jgi:hypothetical protein
MTSRVSGPTREYGECLVACLRIWTRRDRAAYGRSPVPTYVLANGLTPGHAVDLLGQLSNPNGDA